MRKQLFWLSDTEWRRIEPLLPKGRRGARRVDDRRIISGIVHMLRSGVRWRDCPSVNDAYMTVYNRFNRWSRQGLWFEIFEALTGQAMPANGTNSRFPSSTRCTSLLYYRERRTTSVINSSLRHHRLRRTDASAQCESCSIYFVMTRVSLPLPYSSRSSMV